MSFGFVPMFLKRCFQIWRLGPPWPFWGVPSEFCVRRNKGPSECHADTARKDTLVGAFLTAASLFISAVGAYFGATLGGNHRDQQTIVEGWYRPW